MKAFCDVSAHVVFSYAGSVCQNKKEKAVQMSGKKHGRCSCFHTSLGMVWWVWNWCESYASRSPGPNQAEYLWEVKLLIRVSAAVFKLQVGSSAVTLRPIPAIDHAPS